MINRERSRLNIDLDSLWQEDPERVKFCIRYRDLSEPKKEILAKRIKETSQIATIRSTRGPTQEKIKETLAIINPIIFAESQRSYTSYTSHSNFGKNEATSLDGYNFKELCGAIYKMTCIKRELTKKEVTYIAYLSSKDWPKVSAYVNTNYRGTEQQEPVQINTIPEELGLDEIERIRERIDDESEQIPEAMFENQPQQESMPINSYTQIGIDMATENRYVREALARNATERRARELRDQIARRASEMRDSVERRAREGTIRIQDANEIIYHYAPLEPSEPIFISDR